MMAAAVLAVVVLGLWRTSSTAKRGKQHRAAATMQAATRGFLARLLFQAMHMSLALRLIQRVARGMLARRHTTRWRRYHTEYVRTIPRRAAFMIQAAARGFLARRALRRCGPHPSSSGVSATNHTAHAVADGPTMAPEEKGSSGPATPCTVKAKKTRKRGGVKTRGAQKAAASGVPTAPYNVPGIINHKVPDTPCGCGARLAMKLFPYMLPMADFPEAKCGVLREVIVARMERIGWAQPGFLNVIEAAVHAEDMVKQAHPERHPGGDATALVRFLGDYLKQVEHAEALVAARGDVYVDFARVINAYRVAREAAKAHRREEKAIERGAEHAVGLRHGLGLGWRRPHSAHRLPTAQHLSQGQRDDARPALGLRSSADRAPLLEDAAEDVTQQPNWPRTRQLAGCRRNRAPLPRTVREP